MAAETGVSSQGRILLFSVVLMTVVSLAVAAMMISILYDRNFEQRVDDLRAMAEAQASLIGAVARFDAEHSTQDHPDGAWAATISQIVDGHAELGGFGKTGEFVLGRRQGPDFEFLSESRFDGVFQAKYVAGDQVAEPMRLAVAGESGWLIGLDYRGVEVLAAYQPIAELGVGIVAKIDLSEIRTPFLQAAILGVLMALLIILVAVMIVARFIKPMLDQILIFRQFAESVGVGFTIARRDDVLTYANPAAGRILGVDRDDMIGKPIADFDPEDRLNQEVLPALENSDHFQTQGRETGTLDSWFFIRNQVGAPIYLAVVMTDISATLAAEQALRESEGRFERTVAGSGDALWDMDVGSSAAWTSPRFWEMLDLPAPEQMTVDSLFEPMHPEDAAATRELFARHLKSEAVPFDIEIRMRKANGEYIWTHVRAKTERDEQGRGMRTSGSVTDITDYKNTLEALRNLSRATEQSPATVMITDRDGTIQYLNPKFTEVTGYEAEEAIGQNPRMLKSGEQSQEFYEELWQTILSGREWHGEICNRRKNGELYWEFASISPIRTDDGEITHFVGVKEDITLRKEAEWELANAREAAEAANHAKSAFLANMSHELRTPMNAIIGYSELIVEMMEDEGITDFLEDIGKIHSAGRHLLSLINDILDLSKIEAGRMDIYLESFDLRAMMDETRDTVLPLMEKNDNRLTMDLGEDLGTVRTDATKLKQALFNLLSNAAKFTEKGEITVAARRQELDGAEQIVLSVTDTGIGIAAEKLDRVFEEFAQAEETTTRDFGGTGLGLSISRRFCRMMGGDLSVTSVLGQGSTFTIVVPAKADALEVARAAAELPTQDQPEPDGGAESATVLVIDDDPDSREMLMRTFAAGGLDVATAVDGEEGLRLARELQPGVITLDVIMPGMDGWAVLHALKQDPRTQGIPVVMVTVEDERALAFTLGATEYVTKPVDRDLLLRVARGHLQAQDTKCALVVEDDPPTRELIRRTLQDDGWQVLEACNGREGLDQVAAGDPDIVILDLMMPVMDGFDFLAALRAEERHRDLPVIVLTAMELNPEQMKYLESRAGSVLAKGDDELTTALELVRAALS